MSYTTTSASPASATTTLPAVSTPNGPSGIPISRIGAIIGGILGGVIFLLLVSLGVIFFFCSTGRRPGKSKNVKTPKAPEWAKVVWNAEKSMGAGHDHGQANGDGSDGKRVHRHLRIDESQSKGKGKKKSEKKGETKETDIEKGTVDEPKPKKTLADKILPWGQHDPAEYLREQQERQRQQEEQLRRQIAAQMVAQQQQFGSSATNGQQQFHGLSANYPHYQQPLQQHQQFAQHQAYFPTPQAGVQMPQATYQQQPQYGRPVYFPPPGDGKGAWVRIQ